MTELTAEKLQSIFYTDKGKELIIEIQRLVLLNQVAFEEVEKYRKPLRDSYNFIAEPCGKEKHPVETEDDLHWVVDQDRVTGYWIKLADKHREYGFVLTTYFCPILILENKLRFLYGDLFDYLKEEINFPKPLKLNHIKRTQDLFLTIGMQVLMDQGIDVKSEIMKVRPDKNYVVNLVNELHRLT